MSSITEIKVPDIGDFKEVDVIEILVKPGDTVAKEASLITVESDKATMEIPSPAAGVVKELKVKLGDKVAEGSMILLLEASEGEAPAPQPAKTDSSTPALQQQVGGSPPAVAEIPPPSAPARELLLRQCPWSGPTPAAPVPLAP
jgi:pyruvate/2-oxoglutarate dehydrogenase complex dihydrolipoamide acyltransferase (E2) component